MTATRTRHYSATTTAGLDQARRMWSVALDLNSKDRVQFTHNGATVTGTFMSRGEWTVKRSVVNYSIDVRLSTDEARRYMLSDVTDLRPAPLTGSLPECSGFVGTGARCADCRILRRNHA